MATHAFLFTVFPKFPIQQMMKEVWMYFGIFHPCQPIFYCLLPQSTAIIYTQWGSWLVLPRLYYSGLLLCQSNLDARAHTWTCQLHWEKNLQIFFFSWRQILRSSAWCKNPAAVWLFPQESLCVSSLVHHTPSCLSTPCCVQLLLLNSTVLTVWGALHPLSTLQVLLNWRSLL